MRIFDAAEGALLLNLILLPGIVSESLTKEERVCVRGSAGVCAYVHLGYSRVHACVYAAACMYVCVCT